MLRRLGLASLLMLTTPLAVLLGAAAGAAAMGVGWLRAAMDVLRGG